MDAHRGIVETKTTARRNNSSLAGQPASRVCVKGEEEQGVRAAPDDL